MRALILASGLASAAFLAPDAQAQYVPPWRSYAATGDTADIVPSPMVAAALGKKVDTLDGVVVGLTVDNAPSIGTFLTTGETIAQLVTGAIDAGPVINRALATGGATLPCGIYTVHTAIVYPNDGDVLRGFNQACVTLKVTLAAGNVIAMLTNNYDTLRDLTVEADVARASGFALAIGSVFHAKVDNVMFTNGSGGEHYGLILVNAANTTRINDVEGRGSSSYGYYLTGYAVDTFIGNSNIYASSVGLHIDYASGIYLHDIDVVASTGTGVLVDPPTGENVNALYAVNVLSDSSVGNDWVFSGPGYITETKLTNAWGANAGTVGGVATTPESGLVVSDPNLDGLSIAASHFHGNTANGILISAGKNIEIGAGTDTEMNSFMGSGQYDGVQVTGGTTIRIEDIYSGVGGFYADEGGRTNWQRYGINVASGESTAVVSIIGNITGSNVVAGVTAPTGSGIINSLNQGN